MTNNKKICHVGRGELTLKGRVVCSLLLVIVGYIFLFILMKELFLQRPKEILRTIAPPSLIIMKKVLVLYDWACMFFFATVVCVLPVFVSSQARYPEALASHRRASRFPEDVSFLYEGNFSDSVSRDRASRSVY